MRASTSGRSAGERLLLLATPAAAMAAVALGLRIGVRDAVRGAIVYAAPAAAGGRALAWQVHVFDEDRGLREPAARVPVTVRAQIGGAASLWQGTTDIDGVAEAQLAPPPPRLEGLELDVRSGDETLAQGSVAAPPAVAPMGQRDGGWLTFARREGRIALDVGLLGRRAAPGFPAELWVYAGDSATRAPLAHVVIAPQDDTSLSLAGPGTTDGRGWARVIVTPVGLAVTATLDARSPDGRSGTWTGGIFMSPGAPQLVTRRRWTPLERVDIAVTMPTPRAIAYLEIDDAHGRAWATALPLETRGDGTAYAEAAAGALPPGLYWAVASADPSGATTLAAGTTALPFFVASSDEAAMAYGTDVTACVPPADSRDGARAMSACLALSAIEPVTRWVALDGFAMQRALDGRARAKGLMVALGALAVAMVLETALLLRAARGSPLRTIVLALLVGLLGLALLAAFVGRV